MNRYYFEKCRSFYPQNRTYSLALPYNKNFLTRNDANFIDTLSDILIIIDLILWVVVVVQASAQIEHSNCYSLKFIDCELNVNQEWYDLSQVIRFPRKFNIDANSTFCVITSEQLYRKSPLFGLFGFVRNYQEALEIATE